MTLTSFAVLVVLAATAEDKERAETLDRYGRCHSELSFGYLGEWRDATQGSWELSSNDAPLSSAALVTPFAGAPFSGFRAAGLTLESRTVWDGVRFTVGLRWPYASFRMADTVQTVELAGESKQLLVRSLSMWEVRTGLGFELPFRRLTPFFDVLGDVQNQTASVVIDGTPTTWRATGFALGARAGVRVQVSQVFLVLAGEASVLGAPRYGGAFQAGLAF